MTVLIHPALAKADAKETLKKMEYNLGMIATATGHFVLPNGQHPAMRATKPARMHVIKPNHGPYNGGGAAA